MADEGAQNVARTDRLSSLPRDVQSLIFAFAYGKDAYSSPTSPKRLALLARPISKALLPVQRESLYGQVVLTSYHQLDRFARAVNGSAAIAKEVRGLAIDVNWRSHGTIENPVKVEVANLSSTSRAALRQLFQAVVNLQWLDVKGSSRVAAAILALPGADSRFQSLEALALESSFDSFTGPFNLPHFLCVEHWTKLDSLTYIVEREVDSLRLETDANFIPVLPPKPAPTFPQVKSLHLEGPVAKSVWNLALFPSFTSLTALTLHDSADETGSYGKRVFQALPNSQLLESLSYKRSDATHQIDMATITPFLRDVVDLLVGGEGVLIKHSFYVAINKLPLRTLTFDIGLKGVQTAELSKVVSGDNKHATLTKLYLDHIKHCAHEGFFPEWTQRFQPKGLEKFLSLAEREGIEVGGQALWALSHVDDRVPISELLANMDDYKARYRNFAIGLETSAAEFFG
ncbi:hypothetical protein JCM6882_008370 [Rhodosporidiobolus microsporus]